MRNYARAFEHRVDPQHALNEANRAYERRYLHIGDPVDGLMRVDGLLHSEAGAALRRAIDAQTAPSKDDDRTPGQRRADRLMELVVRAAGRSADGGGSRPYLIIRASVDTLVGSRGAPAGELEDGGAVPAETVRRLACDSAIMRIIGTGELDGEISKASRTIRPGTRRGLALRDRHCVFPGCDRPPSWCDGHHLKFWSEGGPTTLENLALLCRPHHRKVHEGGWRLVRRKDGRFAAIPPVRAKPPP